MLPTIYRLAVVVVVAAMTDSVILLLPNAAESSDKYNKKVQVWVCV